MILLAALAVARAGPLLVRLLDRPGGPRSVYVTVAFAAFCWLFVATVLVPARPVRPAARAARSASTSVAGGRAARRRSAALVAAIGLERALTVWNDQMALLPWGLSRILGITVYLGIPTWLPGAVAVLGIILVAAGGALSTGRPRRPRPVP